MADYGYDDGYTGIRRFLNPRDPKVRIGVLVVLGAVVVWFLWSTIGSLSGDAPVVISDELHVVCTEPECNAESVVSRSAHARKVKGNSSPLAVYPDCPKCNKRFASESAKAVRKAVQSGKVIDKYAFDLICPHCKHDLKGVAAHD